MATKRTLQKVAYGILLAQVVFIFTLRDKTMIPFCIINFMMHTMYVHTGMLFVTDFHRQLRFEEQHAKSIEDYCQRREKKRHLLDAELSRSLDLVQEKSSKENSVDDSAKDASDSKSIQKKQQARTYL